MQHRRFFIAFMFFTIAPFFAFMAINIRYDPFYDLAYLTGRPSPTPRTVSHYAELKYKLVLARRLAGRRAIVLLGSSTTAAIDPELGRLPSRLPVYNLAFSNADIHQIESMVHRLAKLSPRLFLVVGLDFFAASAHRTRKFMYLSDDETRARADALMRLSSPNTTIDWLNGRGDLGLTFAERGWRIFTRPRPRVSALRPDPHGEIRLYNHFALTPDYRERLRAIARTNPKARFFISPLHTAHYKLLLELGLDGLYCDWVQLVHDTVDVVDFSFIPETRDATHFVDTMHYRAELGFHLLKTVLDDEWGQSGFDRERCRASFQALHNDGSEQRSSIAAQ